MHTRLAFSEGKVIRTGFSKHIVAVGYDSGGGDGAATSAIFRNFRDLQLKLEKASVEIEDVSLDNKDISGCVPLKSEALDIVITGILSDIARTLSLRQNFLFRISIVRLTFNWSEVFWPDKSHHYCFHDVEVQLPG